MEDIENYEPDSSGKLDLKYQGLCGVPPRVFSYTTRIVCLDVSFNLLHSLPEEICLLPLEELYCASNKISAMPESIGSIQSLRIIKANNNMLVSLPTSIGQLQKIEQLILSDNMFSSLPDEIGNCQHLKSLLLGTNALSRLPLSLALLKGKLIELDVSRNDKQMLTTLPSQIRQDAQSILWILALQGEKTHCIKTLKTEVKMLQHQIHSSEEALAQARQDMVVLEKKKKRLEDDLESVRYILTVRHHSRELRRKTLELWQSVRRNCARKYSEQVNSVV